LFIQASHLYKKNKNQNELTKEHIDAIITAYKNRKTTHKEADTTNIAISQLVNREEIESNDYNLNITRYIDSSTKEEQIDLTKTVNKIQELKIKEEQINKELFDFCKELGIADPC
jgi:type I restriction enzyme M protein